MEEESWGREPCPCPSAAGWLRWSQKTRTYETAPNPSVDPTSLKREQETSVVAAADPKNRWHWQVAVETMLVTVVTQTSRRPRSQHLAVGLSRPRLSLPPRGRLRYAACA